MKREDVRKLLLESADHQYKDFNDKIANCEAAPSIGVRVPKVRQIADLVVKGGWQEYLDEMEALAGAEPAALKNDEVFEQSVPVLYQEEHMLQGIVIGRAKMTEESRIAHLDCWIPGILSWADCDCSVSSFKFMKKNQDFWFDYNKKWLAGGKEFEMRYAIVAYMQYFIHEIYIDRVLDIFSEDYDGGDAQDSLYYVKMAQAWALSVCFVKFRDKTLKLFEERRMDAWVQNKAIQKCRESFRVSEEDKERLKALKIS